MEQPKKRQRAVSRLVNAAKNSSGRRRHYNVQRYYQSRDAALAAAFTVWERWEGSNRPPLTQLLAIASKIDPYAKSAEPVIARGISNGNGDWKRIVMRFGIENRIRHAMTVRLLAELAELQPQQYILQGGMPAAIKRVIELMELGYVYAIEIDVSKCFSSFVGEKVCQILPLPKKVIDHTILANALNIVPHKVTINMVGPESEGGPAPQLDEFLYLARQGIPQGSAASSIVAEMLLSCVFVGLPQCGYCVNYGDNILVLAKSEEDAVTMFTALESAIVAHPAGPLQPKFRFFGKDDAVLFLGHSFRYAEGKVIVRPSPENEHQFNQRLHSVVSRIKKHRQSFKFSAAVCEAQRGLRFALSWLAAFAASSDIQVRRSNAILSLNGALGFDHTDISWKKVKPHNLASGLEWPGG